MIRMGILSDSDTGAKSTQLIQQFKELKISGLSVDTEKQGENYSQSVSEMISNTDGIYLNLPSTPPDLLKTAIRRSNHIFTRNMPHLSSQELKELINLEDEAGCVTQIFNPYIFLSENLKLFNQLKTPCLINVRLTAEPEMPVEDQLINVILYLVMIDKSGFKRLEVLTLEGEDHSFVLDVRITFSSGSIARLIFSSQFFKDQSIVEIFQKGEPIISFQLAPLSEGKKLASEQNAIKQFIKAIRKKPAVLISLNEYLEAKLILVELKEKLKYRGSSLLA